MRGDYRIIIQAKEHVPGELIKPFKEFIKSMPGAEIKQFLPKCKIVCEVKYDEYRDPQKIADTISKYMLVDVRAFFKHELIHMI